MRRRETKAQRLERVAKQRERIERGRALGIENIKSGYVCEDEGCGRVATREWGGQGPYLNICDDCDNKNKHARTLDSVLWDLNYKRWGATERETTREPHTWDSQA